jgi:pyrimidine-nucleoside phosphorylase
MSMYDLILKKRNGAALSKEEIDTFISEYSTGKIPDYQASALLMAIYFRGLTKEETFFLTDAMKNSGEVADLSKIKGIKVDKHSTGGVGDKTTLIVGPLAASCGVPIAKMSGRGLGFTGGTVDKMEAIPGFRTALEPEEFMELVNKIGLSVIGQSAHIAVADKKLYALRDVTATVDSIGLITSSIMSKKLASGSDAIVLDVKCGNGAFMEKLEDAEELSRWMVDIGKAAGKKTVAFITDMSQPLGLAVGNSLEVIEAIETLKNKGPEDITELSLRLSAYMVYLGGKANTPEEAYKLVNEKLTNGEGLKKLSQFIVGQGGNPEVINDYTLLPGALHTKEIKSIDSGYIASIDARSIGNASLHSGAGRETKDDIIDLGAGIVLNKKVGNSVKKDDILATLYSNDKAKLEKASKIAKDAFVISKDKPELPKLIKEIIE